MRRFIRWEHWTLIPILGLAFYLTFLPHQGYPYPVHIDEWVHMAYAEAILQAQDAIFVDPFLGKETIISLGSYLEIGFQLFWAIFQRISGLSWMPIFRFFPSLVFIMAVLSVYIMAKKEGFGWEAALLACLVPTTVGILGPAFLVPVGMALLYIPLSLFLAFNFQSWRSYCILFIFVSFLMTMHSPSAILLLIVLVPFITLSLFKGFGHGMGLALALLLPFLLALPWIAPSAIVQDIVRNVFVPKPLPQYHDLPMLIKLYGYPALALCLLGVFVLSLRGDKKGFGLILGLLGITFMLALFYTFHYGVTIMYLRGIPAMSIMAGIVGGAGLGGIKKLGFSGRWRFLSSSGLSFLARNIGKVLCLVLIVLTLAVAIPARRSTPYYYMINQEDYQAFVWIRDNLDSQYKKAVLDPWKATAFSAITRKNVYTRIHVAPEPSDAKAREFLSGGSTDTSFLRENNITIVYAPGGSSNPELVEVKENIYLFKQGANP